MPFGGLLTAGLVSAGGSILGGLFGSNAASKAAKQQAAGINNGVTRLDQAMDFANHENDVSLAAEKGILQPYLNAGNVGLQQLIAGISPGGQFTQTLTPQQILQQDPGYNFQLQQGTQAIQREAAANGTGATGGELKDALTYSQGLAENAYQQAFQNFNTVQNQDFSRLMSTVGIGQTADEQMNADQAQYLANQLGITQGTAQNVAQLYGEEGSAQAAGTLGGANSWMNALNGIGNTALQLGALSSYKSANQPTATPLPSLTDAMAMGLVNPSVSTTGLGNEAGVNAPLNLGALGNLPSLDTSSMVRLPGQGGN